MPAENQSEHSGRTKQHAGAPQQQRRIVTRFRNPIIDNCSAVIATVGFPRMGAYVFIPDMVAFRHFLNDVIVGGGFKPGFIPPFCIADDLLVKFRIADAMKRVLLSMTISSRQK